MNKNPRKKEEIRKACVIVPTYNESKNIKKALDLIFLHERTQTTKKKYHVEVLVVDDNSPDGTSLLVEKYMKRNKSVHLLLRKNKEGLGKAYIAGMQHALKMDVQAVCQMDADLSHNPKDLFRMLAKLDSGYDMVIGSRYIKGGGIPSNWPLDRRIKSKLASTIIRKGLRLGNIRDCSGGFKAIRASALRKIDLDSLDVKGYAFQAVIIEAMLHEGGLVTEVPIKFTDRELGKSKMGPNEFYEGWLIIFKVRLKRLKEWFTRKKPQNKIEEASEIMPAEPNEVPKISLSLIKSSN